MMHKLVFKTGIAAVFAFLAPVAEDIGVNGSTVAR